VFKSSGSIRLVMCVFLLVVFVAPRQKTTLASPGELRASPFWGRPRSARLRSAAPGRGAHIAKNPITEQTLHRLPPVI